MGGDPKDQFEHCSGSSHFPFPYAPDFLSLCARRKWQSGIVTKPVYIISQPLITLEYFRKPTFAETQGEGALQERKVENSCDVSHFPGILLRGRQLEYENAEQLTHPSHE